MKLNLIGKIVPVIVIITGVLLPLCGCGGTSGSEVEYVFRREGVKFGTQVVKQRDDGGKKVYSSIERFPYYFQDTTIYRNLTLSEDLEETLGYYSNKEVPGASYRTYLTREGKDYDFLADELQTFEFVPQFRVPGGLMPVEPDSAVLLQGILDKFLSAKVEEAVAFVVIPSTSSAVLQILVSRSGEGEVLLSGELLGEVTVVYDGSGVITRVSDSARGTEIIKGDVRKITSRSYEPSTEEVDIKEVRVGAADGVELAGSLYLPEVEKPYPAVVLAADFGPQNRTGNGVLSQIAAYLAERGIAVLTCDKRGIPKSGGEYADYTFESAEDDLSAQLDYLVLRGDIDIDHIGVLGYGEGGALCSGVAVSNPYVSACVLMATPSVRLFPDLELMDIENDSPETESGEAVAAMSKAQIENLTGLLDYTDDDVTEIGGKSLFLGWMRSQASRDPAADFSAIDVPVLILNGENDDIVDTVQAQQIVDYLTAGGNGDVELIVYERLGHYFGPMVASPPDQLHPQLNDSVLSDIYKWFVDRLIPVEGG